MTDSHRTRTAHTAESRMPFWQDRRIRSRNCHIGSPDTIDLALGNHRNVFT